MRDTCLTDVIFLSWRPKLIFFTHVQSEQLHGPDSALLSAVCLSENKDLTLPGYSCGLVYELDVEVPFQILRWFYHRDNFLFLCYHT